MSAKIGRGRIDMDMDKTGENRWPGAASIAASRLLLCWFIVVTRGWGELARPKE